MPEQPVHSLFPCVYYAAMAAPVQKRIDTQYIARHIGHSADAPRHLLYAIDRAPSTGDTRYVRIFPLNGPHGARSDPQRNAMTS